MQTPPKANWQTIGASKPGTRGRRTMESIRKIAKNLARLWIAFVIVMGVGGTWLFNSGGLLFGDELHDELHQEQDADRAQRELTRKSKAAQRKARVEAKRLGREGWGVEADAAVDPDDGWAIQ